MKCWNGYGSEHSMNLIMIGTFKEASGAQEAKQLLDDLIERVREEPNIHDVRSAPRESRFSDEMLHFLADSNLMTIGSAELEQLLYDVSVEQRGKEVRLRTDESDISAFLKLLIERGARVEVYSAHDYPEDDKA
jgi:hypothetical protein